MKVEDVRKLSDQELKDKSVESRKENMEMRFQHVSGQLTDTSKLKMIRREIARIETVLKERELKAKIEGEK
jgi:large subunit ribosomal protein L29